MTINLKEFKIYCYKLFYNKYNYLLNQTQCHIQTLLKLNIITINERNLRLSDIYKIIIDINSLNNNTLNNEDIYLENIFNNHIQKLGQNINYNDIYEYLYSLSLIPNNIDKKLNNIIRNPFNTINNLLIEFSKNIGLSCLNDILLIYNINNTNTNIDLFNFYNQIFVPIKINQIDKFNYSKEELEQINNNNLFSTNIYIIHNINQSNSNEELLDNNYIMYLNVSNVYFKINGYFKLDPLQIDIRLMSIDTYNKLIIKKKQIESNLSEEERFKKKYLKYCSNHELITMSVDKFLEFLDMKYKRYNEINNKSFPSLMKDFIGKNTNLLYWYDVIKLLLLGSDENINVAGSLYTLLKDKKTNISLVPDIIYDNLVFCNQMKLKKINHVLKEELEKLNEINFESIDHKKKLASCTNIPYYVKVLTMEKINEMKSNNNDYNKQLTYVKTILQFPWTSTTDDNIFANLNKSKSAATKFLINLDEKFEQITYGHQNVKQQISLLIGKLISNPNTSGTSIGLVGPPGVGKTLIAKSLSAILDIPMIMITLGGQNDAELLIGHGYTYSGAQPGIIIRKMCEINNSRCIIYFDELDKSCAKHGAQNEISSILIHLTDPNTNKAFQDRFFQGIDFPLDKIIFIGSYNDSTKIDPILLDRLIEIEVKPYSIDDKIHILENFIIKELTESIGLNIQIDLDKNDIKRFINDYTSEAGVRDLKHKIEEVLLNINKNIIMDKINSNNLILNYDILTKYTNNKNKNYRKLIPKNDQVGYVNGLFATSAGGGGITSIEIIPNKVGSDFQLKLTGSMGDVMKESIQVAFTQASNYVVDKQLILNINQHIKDNFSFGFHIHTPEGSTPKDGPSAGAAFTIGFISLLLNKKINRLVAMTGEMTLSGNITKIGGLIYKLIGAKYAGVKIVLIPSENSSDIGEIIINHKDLFNDDFKYYYIDTIDDIIKYIFC